MTSSHPDAESKNASSVSQEPEKPRYEPIRMPTVEELRAQEVWNNCAVRSVVSGVMGEKPLFIYLIYVAFPFLICIHYLSPVVSWSEAALLI